MSQEEAAPKAKPQLMKCPGCKQIVDVSRYGNHMLGNHKTDLYVSEIPEPGVTGGAGSSVKHTKFTGWLGDQLKNNFYYFALWTVGAMVAGWILIGGRI